jgi:lysophospholipase L1-like esterase
VQQSSLVPEVPLPDARENLKRMITAVKERNGQVLLMGEYMASPELLQSYLELEKELAATYPMVTYLDTYAALGPYSGEGLLADQNHLTEKGCRRLAEAMLPVLKSLLEQLQGG